MKGLLFFVLLIPFLAFGAPEPKPMMVKGLVLNQHNQPLPYANVTVVDPFGEKRKAQTDAQGQFEIQLNLEEADGKQIEVQVEYASYQKNIHSIDYKSGEEKVVVKMKQSLQPLISPDPISPSFSTLQRGQSGRV